MRYRIQFTNGYYKLFDTHRYEDVAIYDLKNRAETALQAINRKTDHARSNHT